MKAKKKSAADSEEIGKPIENSIRESFKDSAYRKHYMLYQVRAAIASAVKSLRVMRGLTQKQLAHRAGVPQSQIARLEGLKDERIPSLQQLVNIFTALESRAFLEIVPLASPRAAKREIALAGERFSQFMARSPLRGFLVPGRSGETLRK